MKLTHLMFADDLILFCKGDVQSVNLFVRALNTFFQASGLHVNRDKSAVYIGNVHKDMQRRILQVSGFQRVAFPFRYFGIPITTKRIAKADCDLLVDRMMRRILCWSSRHLYYAVRIVPVNSVLLSIHTYWA